MPLDVWAEGTPNPNAIKFNLSERKWKKGETYASADAAAKSALAKAIFDLGGIQSVFMTANFLTVTAAGADWETLVPKVEKAIKDHFAANP